MSYGLDWTGNKKANCFNLAKTISWFKIWLCNTFGSGLKKKYVWNKVTQIQCIFMFYDTKRISNSLTC